MTNLQKILCAWAVAAGLAAISPSTLAAVTCTVSATPVIFSAYNVWDPFPNNSGIGSVTIDCKGGGGGGGSVRLSTGQSNSYALRTMKSGANTLHYNLYTTAARDLVWGDGTGGSGFMTTGKGNKPITLSVFGQIPAGQDAAVGDYTDSVTVFVEF